MTLLDRLRRAVRGTGEAQVAPSGRVDRASDEVMARQLQDSFDREQAQTQQQALQASAADHALAQKLQAQESRRPQPVQQPPPLAQRPPPPAQQPQPGALPSWIARPLAALQQSVMGLQQPTRLLTCTVCQGNMFSMQVGSACHLKMSCLKPCQVQRGAALPVSPCPTTAKIWCCTAERATDCVE